MVRIISAVVALVLSVHVNRVGAAEPEPYRLPSVDLQQPIVWGTTCEGGGIELAFGGLNQDAPDGRAGTRIRKPGGAWREIGADLRQLNPFQAAYEKLDALIEQIKVLDAEERARFFDRRASSTDRDRVLGPALAEIQALLHRHVEDAGEQGELLAKASGLVDEAGREVIRNVKQVDRATVDAREATRITLERARDLLAAEPPPRALSPIVFDPKSKVFVLFGGDHLDHLTNDLWVFNPAGPSWRCRLTDNAPSPRAKNSLVARGDGAVIVGGGYYFSNNTDYTGGPYVDYADGEFVCDLATNRWTKKGESPPPVSPRVYRAGALHPSFYLQDPAPDPAAFAAVLESLPVNVWVKTNPPHLPQLNRDWGTAILDPDRDLILRWSGGHSAHGGTDVLHYHIATNRWELTAPVEFPLGQLYANTDYPRGVSFNRRAWITGHTYQNYGYDAVAKQMIHAGQMELGFFYDPDRGDWGESFVKPDGLNYSNCFYTITTCSTPAGLIAWNDREEPGLFRFGAAAKNFLAMKTSGEALRPSSVDNSTMLYDTKRDRLLLFRKDYGDDHRYDGKIQEVDLKTLAVRTINPAGAERAGDIPYLCQIRYDAAHDLLLVGATLPPTDGSGLRRTPAYDCATDRWMTLKITGDDPSDEPGADRDGRNVSLGMMYDAKRKLFWAVDTNSQVYVLRLDVATADVKPL